RAPPPCSPVLKTSSGRYPSGLDFVSVSRGILPERDRLLLQARERRSRSGFGFVCRGCLWSQRTAGQETTARTSLYKTNLSPELDGRAVVKSRHSEKSKEVQAASNARKTISVGSAFRSNALMRFMLSRWRLPASFARRDCRLRCTAS